MKHTYYLRTLIFSILFINLIFAQGRRRPDGGLVTGIVVDAANQTPIEYAYVILYNQADSSQVDGTITDEDGRFLLRVKKHGDFYLNINYMGFEPYTKNIKIGTARGTRRVQLDEIALKEAISAGETIEVQAEKPAMTYLIDKKVINVSQHQTATSGTAVEVLENIPSIQVDIEGNVSLRGSTSFQVLIDNKPTILEANEVLQQIPASSIEDIEIITNPSAKYDPDGTAGIINIITRKDALKGFGGMVDVNLGSGDKYGTEVDLTYRMKKWTLYLGGDFNNRSFDGTSSQERRITFGDTTRYTSSSGSSNRGGLRYDLKAGADYNLTAKDVIGLSLRWGGRDFERNSDLDYRYWSEPASLEQISLSKSNSERSGDFLSSSLNYSHQFRTKGHQLIGQVIYQQRASDELSLDELRDPDQLILEGRKVKEQGPAENWRTKLDYTLPLGKDTRFEAGYQSRLGSSEDKTKNYDWDAVQQKYILQAQLNSQVTYKRDIHSIYTQYAGKLGALGYQGGLRTEFTDRNFKLTNQDQSYVLNRWDWFPSAHFSYQISTHQQMMASYTRRIKRPRGHYFEPFLTWMDAYNVRQGNPDLKPEYIDSYEFGYQKYFGKSLFSLEGYYRLVNNKIERVQSVYSPTVTLHTFSNAGKTYTLGSELMLNLDLFPFWNVNLMGNVYHYRIEGVLDQLDIDNQSDNWSLRFNNTFTLPMATRLQVNASYNSPTVTAQGKSEGFTMVNVGLRQQFFNRAMAVTLQVRDLLQTAKHDFESTAPGYYSNATFRREAPVVMLNISYRLSDYQKKRQNRNKDSQSIDTEEDDF